MFYATPNGTAMEGVRPLLDNGVKVIDLSADFRIKDVALGLVQHGALKPRFGGGSGLRSSRDQS